MVNFKRYPLVLGKPNCHEWKVYSDPISTVLVQVQKYET